jgi:uncharacterized protein YraI
LRTILAALALILAVPILPVATASLTQAQTIAYAASGATNLRAGPGTYYAVIGRVYGGTQVYLISSRGGWCYVSVNGQRGWIAASRLRFAYARAPSTLPQHFYVPPIPRPYYYGPSFSFRFHDFKGDRRWDRRDQGDWRERREDWRWRRGGNRGRSLD